MKWLGTRAFHDLVTVDRASRTPYRLPFPSAAKVRLDLVWDSTVELESPPIPALGASQRVRPTSPNMAYRPTKANATFHNASSRCGMARGLSITSN
ncbi:hypothetical protein IE81DRAFT_322254 [Ceraceosorus guamensis]|uniref:Uncharacterized protein n=1 Tax=Ceraceosorus guamensis TaxID=1522189 RepID=A0A316W7H0_9BASI|nr:hypothetical protein IE81DRAFT_322254 [Ceraceosorus guamensis]PWN43595.1 hypothetical protein IE81DRAFT_322254 [Ceraceosorus guamensis]